MSPEFVDAEIQGYHRTKSSDRYALGMVIYEVLSGRVPFYQHADWTIPEKVVKGDRPERPQGSGGVWFTDAVWKMLKHCWVAQPKNRSSIEDVLRCLEKASKTDHRLLQKGDADNNGVFPFAHELPDPYHGGPGRPISTKISAPTNISQMSSYNNPPLEGSPFTSVVAPSDDRLSPIPDKDEKANNCTPLLPVLPGPSNLSNVTKDVVAAPPSTLATARIVEGLSHISYPEAVTTPKPKRKAKSNKRKLT